MNTERTQQAAALKQAITLYINPTAVNVVGQSYSQYSTESYPLVVRRSLWLVLDVAVHRLPGYRQAIEMGHLQRAHLLGLWSRPFLHALVWQQNKDGEKLTVCSFLEWWNWCAAEEGLWGLTWSTIMLTTRLPKPSGHIPTLWGCHWAVALNLPLWSHMTSTRHAGENACCWKTNLCLLSTAAATEQEAGTNE